MQEGRPVRLHHDPRIFTPTEEIVSSCIRQKENIPSLGTHEKNILLRNMVSALELEPDVIWFESPSQVRVTLEIRE